MTVMMCSSFALRSTTVIVLTVLCACFQEKTCQGESTCAAFADPQGVIPPSDFVRVTSRSLGHADNDYLLTLRVLSEQAYPALCRRLSFADTPSPNASPLVGENLFALDASLFVNGHAVWTNGHEFLSFVPHTHTNTDRDNNNNDDTNKDENSESLSGNWLVGVEPGVDNGYVYLESSRAALSPFSASVSLSAQGEQRVWHWLQHGEWTPQPQMSMFCRDHEHEQDTHTRTEDRPITGATHFVVEYFDPRDDPLSFHTHKALFLPDIDTRELSRLGFSLSPQSLSSSHTESKRVHGLLDVTRRVVHVVTNAQVLAVMGETHTLTHSHSQTRSLTRSRSLTEREQAVLVNVEHGAAAWRLTFRSLSVSTDTDNTSLNAQTHASPTTHKEISVDLSSAGWSQTEVSLLSSEEEKANEQERMRALLDNTQTGDYLWLWFSPSLSSSFPAQERTVEELLLHCVAHSSSRWVFELHLAHRVKVMQRSVLSSTVDLLVIEEIEREDTKERVFSATLRQGEREKSIDIHSLITLGRDPLQFVWDFIFFKENKLGGLSSCFMYHAAYSLPQPLLYANEILCVLAGSKPVTMIQYDSPSEHQWKFPLVRDLSQAIVAARAFFGSSFPFKHEIFNYAKDSTLLLFHENSTHCLRALRPAKEAQALHPLPFLDDSTPVRQRETASEQVFNAAWNGLALGYPPRFVLSYCESLAGDRLSVQRKREVFLEAERLFIQESKIREKEGNTRKCEIGVGLNSPLRAEHWQFIKDAVLHSKQRQ